MYEVSNTEAKCLGGFQDFNALLVLPKTKDTSQAVIHNGLRIKKYFPTYSEELIPKIQKWISQKRLGFIHKDGTICFHEKTPYCFDSSKHLIFVDQYTIKKIPKSEYDDLLQSVARKEEKPLLEWIKELEKEGEEIQNPNLLGELIVNYSQNMDVNREILNKLENLILTEKHPQSIILACLISAQDSLLIETLVEMAFTHAKDLLYHHPVELMQQLLEEEKVYAIQAILNRDIEIAKNPQIIATLLSYQGAHVDLLKTILDAVKFFMAVDR